MGCLRRLFLLGTVIVQFVTFGWVLLVIGNAGVLGEAAVLSADDALVAFILAAIAAALTVIQVLVLWQGGRARRRLTAELGAARSQLDQRPVISNQPHPGGAFSGGPYQGPR